MAISNRHHCIQTLIPLVNGIQINFQLHSNSCLLMLIALLRLLIYLLNHVIYLIKLGRRDSIVRCISGADYDGV